MLNILIVTIAYVLVFISDKYAGNYYYLAYAFSYACIAGIAARACILTNSKLLLVYAVMSIIISVSCLAVSVAFYDELKWIIWNAPINLGMTIDLIEVALIITGCGGVIIYITNMLNNYNDKCKGSFNSMDNIK